jgi:hypothetical protein
MLVIGYLVINYWLQTTHNLVTHNRKILWVDAEEACKAHTLEVIGSNPIPATFFELKIRD